VLKVRPSTVCDVLVMPVIGTHEPEPVVYSTVYDVMGFPLSLGASHESATLSDVLEVTVRPVGASGGPVDVVVAVASLTYEHGTQHVHIPLCVYCVCFAGTCPCPARFTVATVTSYVVPARCKADDSDSLLQRNERLLWGGTRKT